MAYMCFVHPIFGFWSTIVKKITQPKLPKTKNELTKIHNEPGIKYQQPKYENMGYTKQQSMKSHGLKSHGLKSHGLKSHGLKYHGLKILTVLFAIVSAYIT
jgi:hypothetical protein